MGTALDPYLNFRSNARQAMEFYREVFGGTLTIATFAEYQASSDPSEDDLVMHASLEAPGGIRLMASDVPASMELQQGTNVSLSLSGDSADELRGYFEKLSDGGSIIMPLEKAPWGDTFGMCVDRFGTRWMVNISG
ncbi:MAG TPA: VOC family protein [Actinomycetota bacterium]|nr:VOC family protein [Actinomycetota bacterium]